MRVSTFLAVLAPVVAVVAQDPSSATGTPAGTPSTPAGTSSAAVPTSTDGVSQCVITCSTAAALSAGCTSFTDFACVCTSEAFQTAAGTCIQSTCTPEEYAASVALSQITCAAFTNGTTSASGTASGTSSVIGTPSPATGTGTTAKPPPATGGTTAAGTTASPAGSSPAASGAAGALAPLPGSGIVTAVGAVFLAVVAGPLAIFA